MKSAGLKFRFLPCFFFQVWAKSLLPSSTQTGLRARKWPPERVFAQASHDPSRAADSESCAKNLRNFKPAVFDHVRAAVHTQVLFLPAYSPDLNPIEKMWSKVKSSLRAAEARTRDDLIRAIGQALDKVTSHDALGWFVSCGYSFC
jgi:transposase